MKKKCINGLKELSIKKSIIFITHYLLHRYLMQLLVSESIFIDNFFFEAKTTELVYNFSIFTIILYHVGSGKKKQDCRKGDPIYFKCLAPQYVEVNSV